MNPDIPLQLLGGITAREFLRDYWQKKPLLIRQAIPDFESPIDPDELAGLALEEEVESRLVIEHGERPWELRRGPFAEDEFSKLPETEWTLLVQAVDQFVPEVGELLERFRFLPSWRVDDVMISFAARVAASARTSTTTMCSCCKVTASATGKSARCAIPRASCCHTRTCASSPTSKPPMSGSWSRVTCFTCRHAWPIAASRLMTA